MMMSDFNVYDVQARTRKRIGVLLIHAGLIFLILGEIVTMSLDTLRANKLKSALTVLGVVIGITSIVGMTSLIRGFDSSLRQSISALGPNTVVRASYEYFDDERGADRQPGRHSDSLQTFHVSSPNPDSTSRTRASTASASSWQSRPSAYSAKESQRRVRRNVSGSVRRSQRSLAGQ